MGSIKKSMRGKSPHFNGEDFHIFRKQWRRKMGAGRSPPPPFGDFPKKIIGNIGKSGLKSKNPGLTFCDFDPVFGKSLTYFFGFYP